MSAKMHVPELRFGEFSGEWEKKKLKSITLKIGSGSTPRGGDKVYQSHGIPFIRSQNVNNNRLSLDDTTYISEDINSEMKNSVVHSLDILLNITGASIGRSCVVPENFLVGNVNQHVCIIRLDDNNIPYFLQPLLASHSGQKLIYEGQTGSGREGLNFQSIASFNFVLPSKLEQEKIASFLSSVDSKIEQLSKKGTLLEQYKKGVMQKIFSQELRFKDDDGSEFPEWVEKKLGDIAVKKSSNISANRIEDNVGKYIIYGASGILKLVDFYEEAKDYVSIIKDGAGVGRILYCKGKSSVLGTMDIIKAKTELDTYFLYCLLDNVNFTKYVSGSTIPHIYFKDYSNEKCKLPSLKEQTKIATFLSSLDKKIELIDKELNATKEFKKALLQKMFV